MYVLVYTCLYLKLFILVRCLCSFVYTCTLFILLRAVRHMALSGTSGYLLSLKTECHIPNAKQAFKCTYVMILAVVLVLTSVGFVDAVFHCPHYQLRPVDNKRQQVS